MATTSLFERYQRDGLTPPIRLWMGWRARLLIWLGGPALIAAAAFAAWKGGILVAPIGVFGLLFFGLCQALLVSAVINGWRRGMVRLSADGLYLSTIDLELPWEDIGGAHSRTTAHQGGRTVDVNFVLRRYERHRRRAEPIGRALLGFAKRLSDQPDDGVAATAARAAMALGGVSQTTPHGFDDPMDEARAFRNVETDAALYTIPGLFLSEPEDLAAVINAQVTRRGA